MSENASADPIQPPAADGMLSRILSSGVFKVSVVTIAAIIALTIIVVVLLRRMDVLKMSFTSTKSQLDMLEERMDSLSRKAPTEEDDIRIPLDSDSEAGSDTEDK